ncbi:MAG: hypothetical protein ACOYNS_18000, partial [Bacteroidota bacterium]
TNELNERYEEFSQQNITTVHNGIPFDPSRWQNETVAQQPIILVPAPDPYWPGPAAPVNPWWAPPISTTGTSSNGPVNTSGNKIRDNGPSRDGNRSGDRNTPIPSPTYSQPTSSGSSSSSVTAPPPSTYIAPAPQPAQTNTNERSRDSNSSTGSTSRTRDSGASRDDGGERPR